MNFLYCETSHDGYEDGLGYALLASSAKMEELTEIMKACAGTICYYEQSSKTIKIDREIDYYYDASPDLCAQYTKAFALIKNGELEKARQLDFWSVPLEKKATKEFCMNSSIVQENYHFYDASNIKELYDFLVKFKTDEDIYGNYTYIWKDGQLHQQVEIEGSEDKGNYAIPFVANMFFSADPEEHESPTGCYASIEKYFYTDITEKDLKTIEAIYEYNKIHKLLLLNPFAQIKMDKYDLEKSTPQSPNSAVKLKV